MSATQHFKGNYPRIYSFLGLFDKIIKALEKHFQGLHFNHYYLVKNKSSTIANILHRYNNSRAGQYITIYTHNIPFHLAGNTKANHKYNYLNVLLIRLLGLCCNGVTKFNFSDLLLVFIW